MILPLVGGYVLDLIVGDPDYLPHPIRVFGNLIAFGEKILNRGNHRLLKGALLSMLLCCSVWAFFYFALHFLVGLHVVAGSVFATIIMFYGLANTNLISEGKAVFEALQQRGTEAGRMQLSRIVGRDTSQLTDNQIRIAVCETLSENLSDGVIAPLCYYAIGGIPGMMTYKMINTLDSMIGYKSERYLYFGRFAARLDDVANFLPARLTALLMVIVTGSRRGWQFVKRYGRQHASPNSGYPEAALAGILDCRFGGPNVYHGKLVAKPWIGSRNREIAHSEFRKIAAINQKVVLLTVLIILTIHFFLFQLTYL